MINVIKKRVDIVYTYVYASNWYLICYERFE